MFLGIIFLSKSSYNHRNAHASKKPHLAVPKGERNENNAVQYVLLLVGARDEQHVEIKGLWAFTANFFPLSIRFCS